MIWDEKDQKLLDYVRIMLRPDSYYEGLADEMERAEEEKAHLREGITTLTETTPLSENLGITPKPIERNTNMNAQDILTRIENQNTLATHIAAIGDPAARRIVQEAIDEDVVTTLQRRRTEERDTGNRFRQMAEAGLPDEGHRETDGEFWDRWNDTRRLREQTERETARQAAAIVEGITPIGANLTE